MELFLPLQMEPLGPQELLVLLKISMEFFILNPGERAVVPIIWSLNGASEITQCSTHPEAPAGLDVLPGCCSVFGEHMSVVVENV